jgi:hypothetical protein
MSLMDLVRALEADAYQEALADGSDYYAHRAKETNRSRDALRAAIERLERENAALRRVYEAANQDTNPPPPGLSEAQCFDLRVRTANELLAAIGDAHAVLGGGK